MTNNEFLPDDYNIPTKDRYMKFQQGDNRFRILSKPILGYVWFEGEEGNRKPIRIRMNEDDRLPLNINGSSNNPKHFWAMIVWNYSEKMLQILEIKQKTIQEYIRGLAKNPKWGSPLEYDLVVTRKGEGLETEYTIIADPKEELSNDIKKKFEGSHIELDALYEGGDPFEQVMVQDQKEKTDKEIEDDIDEVLK